MVTLTNIGSGDCTVRGLSFGAGSDPAFVLLQGLIVSQVLSPPGTGADPSSLVVPVGFFPPQTGAYTGSLEFTADGESSPWIISLTGLGSSTGCLIVQPAELNFGVEAVSCNATPSAAGKRFVVVNGCDTPQEVQSLTLSGAPFLLLQTPPLPVIVPGGATSPPFSLKFAPTDAGAYIGSAVVETSAGQLGVWFSGSAVTPGPVQEDVFTYTFSGSYVLALSPGLDVASVDLNGAALPLQDWSYDPQTGDLTIGLISLRDGDLLTVHTRYVLTCN
jgi:hypothetical protein